MKDVKQLRSKLKTLLNRFVKHEKAEKLETKIFDHVVSRRDFLVGTAKFTAVAGLLSKGVLPSAWASTPSNIDIEGSKIIIPDSLKQEVNAIARITASADMFKDDIYIRQAEVTQASSYEAVLESTNLCLRSESFPDMLQSNAYKQIKQNPFTKNYGVPELVQLTTRNKDELKENKPQLLKVLIDRPDSDTAALTIDTIEINRKHFDYNTVVAVNGQKHNTLNKDGQIHAQKLILAANVTNPSESDTKTYSIDVWEKQVKAMDEQANGDEFKIISGNLMQMHILYQNDLHSPDEFNNPNIFTYSLSEADIYQSLIDAFRQGKFPTTPSNSYVQIQGDGDQSVSYHKINVGLKSSNPSYDYTKGTRLTIDHIGRFQDNTGASCLYGTIRVNFFWKMGFYITLDGVEPDQPPKIQFFRFEYGTEIMQKAFDLYQNPKKCGFADFAFINTTDKGKMVLFPYIHTTFVPIRINKQGLPTFIAHTFTANDSNEISQNSNDISLQAANIDYFEFAPNDYEDNIVDTAERSKISSKYIARSGIIYDTKQEYGGLPIQNNKKDRKLVGFSLFEENWIESKDKDELRPFWMATRDPIDIQAFLVEIKEADNWTYSQMKAYKRFIIDALTQVSSGEALLKVNETEGEYGLYHATPKNERKDDYYTIVYSNIKFTNNGIEVILEKPVFSTYVDSEYCPNRKLCKVQDDIWPCLRKTPGNNLKLNQIKNALITMNHQDILSIIINSDGGSIMDKNQTDNLFLCRQNASKSIFQQFLTPNAIGPQVVFDPIQKIKNHVIRLLPWQYWYNNVEYIAVEADQNPQLSLFTNKQTPKLLLSEASKQFYVRTTQDPISLSWCSDTINMQVSEDKSKEIEKKYLGFCLQHTVTLSCYNAYSMATAMADNQCIIICPEIPCLVTDKTNPDNLRSSYIDRSRPFYCKANEQGNVILQFKLTRDQLQAGLSFTYQLINKSHFERKGLTMVYRNDLNEGDSPFKPITFNTSKLTSDRFEANYDEAPSQVLLNSSIQLNAQKNLDTVSGFINKSLQNDNTDKAYRDEKARDTVISKFRCGIKGNCEKDTQTQAFSSNHNNKNPQGTLETIEINQPNLLGDSINEVGSLLASAMFQGYDNNKVVLYAHTVSKMSNETYIFEKDQLILGGLFSWISDLVMQVWNAIEEAIDKIKKEFESLIDGLLDLMGPLGDFIRNAIAFISGILEWMFDALMDFVLMVLEFLFSLLWPTGWAIAGEITNLIEKLPKIIAINCTQSGPIMSGLKKIDVKELVESALGESSNLNVPNKTFSNSDIDLSAFKTVKEKNNKQNLISTSSDSQVHSHQLTDGALSSIRESKKQQTDASSAQLQSIDVPDLSSIGNNLIALMSDSLEKMFNEGLDILFDILSILQNPNDNQITEILNKITESIKNIAIDAAEEINDAIELLTTKLSYNVDEISKIDITTIFKALIPGDNFIVNTLAKKGDKISQVFVFAILLSQWPSIKLAGVSESKLSDFIKDNTPSNTTSVMNRNGDWNFDEYQRTKSILNMTMNGLGFIPTRAAITLGEGDKQNPMVEALNIIIKLYNLSKTFLGVNPLGRATIDASTAPQRSKPSSTMELEVITGMIGFDLNYEKKSIPTFEVFGAILDNYVAYIDALVTLFGLFKISSDNFDYVFSLIKLMMNCIDVLLRSLGIWIEKDYYLGNNYYLITNLTSHLVKTLTTIATGYKLINKEKLKNNKAAKLNIETALFAAKEIQEATNILMTKT